MKFVCERCQTRYSIADEKVRQKILKIRCKTCEHVITVREPQAGSAASPPPAPAPPPRPAAREAADWYVAINGVQAGPVTRGDIVKKIAAAKPADEVYVWKEDFDSWKEAAQVPGLAAEVTAAKSATSVPPRAPVPPPLARPAAPRPAAAGSSGRTVLPAPTRGPAPRPAASVGSGQSRAVAARAPAPDSIEETFEGSERTAIAPMDASLLAQELPAPPAGRVLPFPTSAPAPGARPAPMNGAAAHAPAPSPSSPLLDDLFAQTPAHAAAASSAPTPFFPVPTAAVPASPAESGLSRLTGLPGFWSRHSGIKFVALGAAVVLLVGVAAFVLVARPGETKVAAAPAPPPAPAAPAVDPEKQAREEAEQRFKATVGGAAPAVASVSRPEPRREQRRAPRPATPTPAAPVAPPAHVEPSAFSSDHPGTLAGGERVVKTYVPQRERGAAAAAGHPISEQQMAAVVRKNQSGIQTCYERALKRDDKLRGRIEVTTSIGASGMVRKVDLRAPSDLNTVKACIETTIRRWAFPASPEPYEFAFPLILERNL